MQQSRQNAKERIENVRQGPGLSAETERLSVRAPKQTLAELDTLVDNGEFEHRSAAVRDALAEFLDSHDDQHVAIDRGTSWGDV